MTPNYNFEDIDTGESREIDVYAVKGIIDEKNNFMIEQLLLVECKNTSNPFVFFSRPKYEELKGLEDYFDIIGAPESVDAGKTKGILSLERYLNFSNLSHRYKLAETSSQFCVILRKGKNWEAKHEHIYNGMIVPIIKCLSSERVQYRNSIGGELIQLRIIYPIIIVNSDLYLMNSETNELGRKKWILFYRNYESKYIKLTAKIDFVRFKYLNTYLQVINKSFNSLTKHLLKKRQILIAKIKAKKFFMED